MDLNTILEIFGVNGSAAVKVGESALSDSGPIFIEISTDCSCVVMAPEEARYLATRLNYLADKVDQRPKP